jgi:phosphoserine phosphatase
VKKKVLVVDLDGTLFTVNTFHYFIKYLLLYSVANFNLVLLFKIVSAVLFRLLRITTHAKMKYHILKAIANKTDLNYNKFVKSISLKKRNLSILKDTSFDVKILATAAPSCYANSIAKNEQFHVCLGTNFPNSNFDNDFENIKAVKKSNVIKYLANIGLTEIDTLVTDHIDDLPLMKLAKHNIIVAPNTLLQTQLKQNLISFETID